MTHLKSLVVALSLYGISFVCAEGYETKTMAVPLSVFEERYVIDYPTQVLESGDQYNYAGETKESYFIRHSFQDGMTHLVRVPKAHSGEVLIKREGGTLLVSKTFKFTFNHGSVLFDPRKDYPILEDNQDTLLLEINSGIEQIEVAAERFKIKRTLVFDSKDSSSERDSSISTADIDAYLKSHPPSENLPAVKNPVEGICLIDTEEGSGTGFLFAMEGRVYCITNHHVLGNAQEVKISTANGREFTPLHYEVASDRDLARILLKETPACFHGIGAAKIEESVQILGNSGGEGVVTFEEGKVIGHAPKVIEVDADFIAGNSGSPVLNQAGEVVGVATYLKSSGADEDDWVAKKTRFVKARRFATRFTDSLTWIAIDVKRLRQAHLFVAKHLAYIEQSASLILMFSANPESQIIDMGGNNATLSSWVHQTNTFNQKLDLQVQAFRAASQSEYQAGISRLFTERAKGLALQLRKLEHLTKRQITQFHQNEGSLPEVGHYPHQLEDLDSQYALLLDGLSYLSRYYLESAKL